MGWAFSPKCWAAYLNWHLCLLEQFLVAVKAESKQKNSLYISWFMKVMQVVCVWRAMTCIRQVAVQLFYCLQLLYCSCDYILGRMCWLTNYFLRPFWLFLQLSNICGKEKLTVSHILHAAFRCECVLHLLVYSCSWGCIATQHLGPGHCLFTYTIHNICSVSIVNFYSCWQHSVFPAWVNFLPWNIFTCCVAILDVPFPPSLMTLNNFAQ